MNRAIQITTILLSSFLYVGCAIVPVVDFSDPVSIETNISVNYDQFRKTTRIDSPTVQYDNPIGRFLGAPVVLPNAKHISLVSSFTEDQDSDVFILLDDTYQGEWRYYQSATDIEGNDLPYTNTNRDVGSCIQGCNLNEIGFIRISYQYLMNHLEKDIQVRVYGSNGSTDVVIPKLLVATYVNYLDRNYPTVFSN